jgi:hypothetical protein
MTKKEMRVTTRTPPLVTLGEIAVLDSEKAAALADNLETQFQPVTDPSVIETVEVALRAYPFAPTSKPMLTNPDEVQDAVRGNIKFVGNEFFIKYLFCCSFYRPLWPLLLGIPLAPFPTCLTTVFIPQYMCIFTMYRMIIRTQYKKANICFKGVAKFKYYTILKKYN